MSILVMSKIATVLTTLAIIVRAKVSVKVKVPTNDVNADQVDITGSEVRLEKRDSGIFSQALGTSSTRRVVSKASSHGALAAGISGCYSLESIDSLPDTNPACLDS
jgi:hypothetical protein